MRRAGVVVALLAASTGQAQQYLSYKMLATQAEPFRVYVDSRSQQPVGLSYSAMQNSVERAWATWSAASCASVKVRSNGPTAGTVPSPSQTDDAYSVTPVWLLAGDPDLQEIFGGSPYVLGIALPRAYAGVLETCDIFFNGLASGWSLEPTPAEMAVDVETVMLHEAGHCLGLGHYGSIDTVMHQVIEPGLAVRALNPQDLASLCARYPLAGEYASPCLADGGCTQTNLKCLTQPTTNNLTLKLCTQGCGLNTGGGCDIPLSCQSSSAFSGFNGACLLPGNIITEVGKPCAVPGECGSSFSICQTPIAASGSNQFWVEGYCTQSCELGQPVCPAGTTCGQLDIGRRCLQNCRVGLADCRPDYACQQIDSIGTTGVCIPRCYSDVDCADSLNFTCRTCDGLCVPRQNTAGAIGDLCTVDDTCGAGQVCRITDDKSGVKQCTQQCSRGCGTCPGGSVCTPGAQGELFCLKTCTGPNTCPAGLRCAETVVGQGCIPACRSNSDCPVGQNCYNGECYTPMEDDGGCSALTCRPDAGRPITITRDAGTGGTGGSGGCGCQGADPGSALALLGLLGWATRGGAWRRRR